MQDGSEGRNWNARGLRCSGCDKSMLSPKEFIVEIKEWNGKRKTFCSRCLDRWLRGE
jgi:hypothetical protein